MILTRVKFACAAGNFHHNRFLQVEKSDSCQYLQMAQNRAGCKKGVMAVLESRYRADGWHSTGIVPMSSTAPVPMDSFQPSYLSEPRRW